jgi:Fungal fucose-specific lectin
MADLAVRELAYFQGGWHHRDLTAAPEAPTAVANSALAGFRIGDADPRVYFLDAAAHVQELAYFQRRWHHRDVTAATGAPAAVASSALTGFRVTSTDGRVYFLNDAGHVQELAYFQGGWHHRDVTAASAAPAAVASSALVGFSASGDSRVYYLNPAGHVQELVFLQGGWHHRDVTADSGAPAAVANSALAGLTVRSQISDGSIFLDSRVYYLDPAGHVQELAYFQGGWHHRDVTAASAAPAAVANSALAGLTISVHIQGGSSVDVSDPRVYYLNPARHVEELAYFQGSWHHRDVTADSGAPAAVANSTLAGFRVTVRSSGSTSRFTDPRVYYLNPARRVQELAYFRGGWHHRDVTADSGAPTAVANSALAGFAVADRTFVPRDPRVYYLGERQAPQPNGEETRTVDLVRQVIVEGFIPYVGQFPLIGVTPSGRLLRIRLPQVGFPDLALAFVKHGQSTANCGDPGAVVVLAEGQTTTTTQLAEIFGASEPRFSTGNPLFFIACLSQTGGSLPNFVRIEITIAFD